MRVNLANNKRGKMKLKEEHKYQICLTSMTTNPEEKSQEIKFGIVNHDNLFKLLSLIQGKIGLSEKHEKPFLLGLKMFTEVIIKNAQNPLIKKIKRPVAEIMATVKSDFIASKPIEKINQLDID